MTDIAKENHVSLTTINRILDMVSLGKPKGYSTHLTTLTLTDIPKALTTR